MGATSEIGAMGKESFEMRRTAVTVSGNEYANVLDFRDGLITRFVVIRGLCAVIDA